MKAKTIKMVLRKKIDEWTATIEDEDLREEVRKNVIVTGGCIASMLLREKVNDFDVYFKSRDVAENIAKYYVSQFNKNRPKDSGEKHIPIFVQADDDRVRIVVKSAGVAADGADESTYQYFEADPDEDAIAATEYLGQILQDPGDIEEAHEEAEMAALDTVNGYRPVFLSTNAITLSNRVQIIIRFFGEPDEIHENYDFVHCTNYWTSWDNNLVLRPDALETLLTKELRYVGSKYPLCSIIRVRKFVARQWTINAGQILKMSMQLNDLDLSDLEVLEDQLTGVDVAYFNEMIDKLRAKDKKKVDSSYLLEIVDRMF